MDILDRQLERSQQARYQALLRGIAKIRETLDLDVIFQSTATEVRQLLNADRVGVFRFYPDCGYNDGEFVSEAVLSGYTSALAAKIHDHCFGDRYAVHYQQGCIQAVADIYQAGLQECHIAVLSRFQIRANLIVPLLQGEVLWGLLCIHQCDGPRQWEPTEIEFAQQIATQLSIALHQAELLAQTRKQSAELAHALQELRSAQTQLIQTEKMSSLGQLVAGIAHEINNPVNFIYGNLNHAVGYARDLLAVLDAYQQELAQPSASLCDRIDAVDLEFVREDFPKMLSSMQIGADRIRQIVLSLRTFSRLDEAEMKPVNIHEGLDSTLLILQHRLKPKAGTASIKISKNYSELPLVECYASQLNQVFMNVLSNAIDALEDYSDSFQTADSIGTYAEITICTRLMSAADHSIPRVVIRIIDNGPGISEVHQRRLFDPFFTTKPAGKGTGLGLSICYQIIVERHGGSLRCISHPGQGTEFWIEIPISQGVSAQSRAIAATGTTAE